MAREWTARQYDAIYEEGELLVSAAAGAGKTAVLTERIARLIGEGCSPEELLVVTFTKAAASEMKERIGARLISLADEAAKGGDSERAYGLRRAAAACDNASISTLHRFCLSVLHRNYHEAGIDPAVQVASALDAELAAAKAMDDVLEAEYLRNEKAKDADFQALLQAVGSDANLESAIRGLYEFAIARPDPDAWLDEAAERYTTGFEAAAELITDELLDSGVSDLEHFAREARALISDTPTEYRKLASALQGDISLITGLTLNRDYDKWVEALSEVKLDSLSWPRGVDDGEKEPVKKYREEFKKHIDRLKKQFCHTMEEEREAAKTLSGPVRCLRRLTGEFWHRFSELKTEQGLIDFNDMEQLTLRILKNEDIANEYKSRFRAVFVDEYQDINPAQEAILQAVSRGNRFMVGDVKQSIYRFRQADPSIFLEKYSSFRGDGRRRRIDLNCNFRSREAVLEAVNALFSRLMLGKSAGEIDYSDNAALEPGAPTGAGGPHGRVELAIINEAVAVPFPADDEDDFDEGTDALQAAYAASRIHAIMRDERLLTADGERPYRFSDFTVLLRSAAGSADEWVNVLTRSGIPCAASSGTELFEAVEVRVFLDLLRIIDNRRQDIPLAAVMRSPIFAFTDEELIRIKADYEGTDALDRVMQAAADPGAPTWGVKCRALLDAVDGWRAEAKVTELGEFIERLLDETGFRTYVSALRGGEARARGLDSLCETAAAYSASGRGGLSGFLRYADEARARASQKSAPSPAADAVRIMTIHQSKGLEFPVVILGNITKQFNRSFRSDVGVFDAELGIGLCSVSGDRGNKSMLQRAISHREQQRQNAEEMRVLYVAMTRAKEKLIMLGAHRNAAAFTEKRAKPLTPLKIMRADTYADWILGAYFEHGADAPLKLPCGEEISLEISDASGAESGSVGLTGIALEAALQDAAFADSGELAERFGFTYAMAAETKLPTKLSVTGLTKAAAEVAVRPRFMADGAAPTGAEIGTLTHRLLQLVSIAPHTAESVKRELDELTWRGLFTEHEAGLIRISAIVNFFGSELGKRLLLSKRVEREREFDLMVAASELIGSDTDEPIMLQGVIDCCFIENGKWVLLDHKTTRVDGGHTAKTVAERYRRQLELYKLALEKLTGIPVSEAYVYLLSADEAVRM